MINKDEALGWIACFFILLPLAVIAVIAPPNTWDSMTTHMSRVMHWIQNKSLVNYPTPILKQLNYPALGSYGILNFQVLSQSDHYAPFIQWGSFLASMAGVSWITLLLGAGRFVQAFSALISASIPMAILQSTSTQNDILASFLLVAFICCGLYFFKKGGLMYGIIAAMALGLAFFVKGTPYIYGLILWAWALVMYARKQGKKAIVMWGCVLGIAVLLNTAYYLRNYSLTGNIIPSDESRNIIKWQDTVRFIPGSIIRHAELHLMLPYEKWNKYVSRKTDTFLSFIGQDNADRTSMGKEKIILDSRFDEDVSGNCIHLVLYLLAVICLFLARNLLPLDVLTYAGAVIMAGFLFCSIIKWSPYHSRYHLPLFILFAPCAAIALSAIFSKKFNYMAMFVLCVAAIPWILKNDTRPLIGKGNILSLHRRQEYFYRLPQDYSLYSAMVNTAIKSKCRDIGLILGGGDPWEYPYWVFAQGKGFRFEHVNVANVSNKLPYPLGPFSPCALFFSDPPKDPLIVIGGKTFGRSLETVYIRLNYLPEQKQKNTLQFHYKTKQS